MVSKPNGIEFIQTWRGRPPGTEDRQMGYGIHEVLVRRGIARWLHGDDSGSKGAAEKVKRNNRRVDRSTALDSPSV